MFHIKNDKRSEASAILIYNGLCRLVKKERFEEISISSLCKNSMVSRTTFYRNFDIIEDVLKWKCEYEAKKMLEGYKPSVDNDQYDFVIYILKYIMERYELLEVLDKANRVELIENAILKHSVIITSSMLPDIDTSNKFYQYFIAARVGLCIGIIKCWLENGRKEAITDIIGYVVKDRDIRKNLPIIL